MCRQLVASYLRYRLLPTRPREAVMIEHDRAVLGEPRIGFQAANTFDQCRGEGAEGVVRPVPPAAVREPASHVGNR
jgi:hypothetical protein